MQTNEKYYQKFLREALVNKRAAVGTVAFSKKAFSDPDIKKALSFISKALGITVAELVMKVNQKIAEFAPMKAAAPMLYHTITDNMIEDTLFSMFWREVKTRVPGAPTFNKRLFNRLNDHIKLENERFFPMRSFVDAKTLYRPDILWTDDPDGDNSKAHQSVPSGVDINGNPTKGRRGVDTAAATPSGQFVFNIQFMQKLLDWAHLTGLKARGKKYESNGGPYPDGYAYIEFIIMHEYMHYTESDFHYQRIIPKANPKIINWVGDFRSNYLLVKSGYQQLPIGLYNDLINYDRQGRYQEMYDLVKSEFDKLPKDQQKKMSDQMDESSDDHEPGNEEAEGAEPGEGDGQSGEDQNKDDGKAGKDGKERKPSPADDMTPEQIDEHHRKIEEKIKEAKDKSGEEVDREKVAASNAKADAGNNYGGYQRKDNEAGKLDVSKIKPKYNWKDILRMLISSAQPNTEETYTKPARKSITGAYTARQLGAGAMQPGEMPLEHRSAKLCFVVDSSGSMSDVIGEVYANIFNLMKSTPGLLNVEFVFIRFSDGHQMYKCVMGKNRAGEVKKVTDRVSQMDIDLKNLFTEHYGGGTNITPDLTADINFLQKDNYNIVIMSDSDVSGGSNLQHLKFMSNVKSGKLFILMAKRSDYTALRTAMGGASVFTSYIKED